MKEKNSCFNCGYFSQHYAKTGTKYQTVYCGHCLKRNVPRRTSGSFPFSNGCGEWVATDVRKQEQLRSIHRLLTGIEKSLNELKISLREDGSFLPKSET